MSYPRLRDGKHRFRNEPYALGVIPNDVVYEIGKWIAYNFAVGKRDINGEDWGDIFAKSINAKHLNSPIGLADVVLDNMAWSVKSIKNKNPHACRVARVISGRCSPDYSYGITDPHKDVQATGTAVLGIWNERINIAKDRFEPLRSIILIRNPENLEFCLYEHELSRYNTADFEWQKNKNGNLVGRHRDTAKHYFTWQPHGSQFTIVHNIPNSATKFSLKAPPVLDFDSTLKSIGFTNDWVTIYS